MTTSIFNLQASLLFLIPITLLSFFSQSSTSVDTLFSNQSLTGNHTLVSENQCFELGFFTPKDSNNSYLGIWYKNLSPLTVVWVANRNTPLSISSGILKLGENGNILLLNGSESESVIWSSNQSAPGSPIVEKPIAKLLDTGNLVVTQESDEKDRNRYRWQSFDHATDTLLPGMKLGWDLDAGLNNSLISWKSAGDPSAGSYSFLASSYAPELYLYSLNKQKPVYRSGPWNGKQFSGVPEMKSRDGDGISFSFVYNGSRNYYLFMVKEDAMSRVVVDEYGKLKRLVSFDDHHSWNPYWEAPKDQCDRYNQCGAYGICDSNDSPVCNCMKGFKPRNKTDWRYRDGSGGCIRKTDFECGKTDGFSKVKNIKLPDCSKTYYDRNMNLKQCKEMCEKNCSCTAYSSFDIRNGGTGCIIWIGELFDIRLYVNGGQDLYVRLAASDLDHNHKPIAIIITVVVILVAFLSVLTAYFIWKKKKRTPEGLAKKRVNRVKSQEIPFFNMVLPDTRDVSEELKDDDLELPLIDFDIIASITNNFSDSNKLGEGGFGCVYKGTSGDGRQIAVKRLSKHSGQGVEEFKNEVTLIAKLQHRNLVRLLGCCIDGEEKMLIYEYMPNRSLDSFLFDKTKSSILDWGKRFNIIRRIARGLLYLHQDSRFRIIHRDLKVSNILLDAEMNPKISDFGMARIFGGDATEGNTSRVVGTYGYMSPEYAMDGIFSVKSDVFSYGVLVLEIISGKKNRGFFSDRDESNLLGHAWRLWQEGKVLDLIDESMGETFSIYEVMKCVQVGLLCVQEHAEDRPTISSVLVMFCSETATLPQPKQPGFTVRRIPSGTSSSNDQETRSVNQVTVTKLEPR